MPTVDVTRTALTPAVAPAPRTLSGWKEALTMLNSRSIDLLLSQQAVLRAQGSYQQALAAALPTITGSGSYTQNLLRQVNLVTGQSVAPTPILSTQITASQPIFALQTWYGVRTADLNAKAAKLTVEDRRRLVLAQAADAIVGVFTAERIAEINRVSLRNSLQRQSLAERKSRLGDGTRLDASAPSKTPPSRAARSSRATRPCAKPARPSASPLAPRRATAYRRTSPSTT